MITDTIISITRTDSGLHPLHGKIYIRKVKYMKDDYPQIVCLDCLKQAWKDTKEYDDRIGVWSGAYSCYGGYCPICESEQESCTEPRDAGYPNFEYMKVRMRAKKIKKIMNK